MNRIKSHAQGLSFGKTVWNASFSAWSGPSRFAESTLTEGRRDRGRGQGRSGRALADALAFGDAHTVAVILADELSLGETIMTDNAHRVLYTNQPVWCLFQGVVCDNEYGSSNYGRMMSISLNNLNLRGSLPSSIGSFDKLTSFDLGGNHINGTIPSTIGLMTALQNILLEFNQLSGSIPSTIGQMTSLANIYAYNNELTGSIPRTIGLMTSLVNLFFFGNQLNGTIPGTMNALSLLDYVYLGSNYLTMGTASTVASSTFSSYTLSKGHINLDGNCLSFKYGSYSTNGTHCKATAGECVI